MFLIDRNGKAQDVPFGVLLVADIALTEGALSEDSAMRYVKRLFDISEDADPLAESPEEMRIRLENWWDQRHEKWEEIQQRIEKWKEDLRIGREATCR